MLQQIYDLFLKQFHIRLEEAADHNTVASPDMRVLHSLNKDNIKFKIIELTALHSGVRGISEQSIVSRNKFDEEEFGKAHQDIYSKYVKVKEQLSGNFTIIKNLQQLIHIKI